MKHLFALLTGCLLCLWLAAQSGVEHNTVEYFTVEQGLSDRTVWDVLQDSRGYVWIATQNGLNRYDGYQFYIYESDGKNRKGLSGDDVYRIEEDKSGRIVIQYFKEISFIDLLDVNTNEVTKIVLNASSGLQGGVIDIFVERRGNVYVLTKNKTTLEVFQLSEKDNTFTSFLRFHPKQLAQEYRICSTKANTIWLADNAGSFWELGEGGKEEQHIKFSTPSSDSLRENSISIFYQDQIGRLWLSFKNQPAIYVYNPLSKNFQPHPSLPQTVAFQNIWEDEYGGVLMADLHPRAQTASQLWYVSPQDKTADYTPLLKSENRLTSVCGYDFTKLLFFGSHIGLIKLIVTPNKVHTYVSKQLAVNEWGASFRGITGNGKGDVYFAREVKVWYHLNTKTNVLDTLPCIDPATGKQLELRRGSDLHLAQDGSLWGTAIVDTVSLLLRLNLANETWKIYPIPASEYIISFTLASDGKFYLATSTKPETNQLLVFDPKQETFQPYRNKDGSNPLQHHFLRQIVEDSFGQLAIATDEGVIRIDKDNLSSKRYLLTDLVPYANNNLWAIHASKNGVLWLGSYGGGLLRFDPVAGTLSVYDKNQGMGNEKVCAILEDEQENIWVSTFNGIAYFDVKREQFRNFRVKDGLSFHEFNRLSSYRDEDGRLYFGGMNGVNAFYPKDFLQVAQTTTSAPLLLTSFTSFVPEVQDFVVHNDNLNRAIQITLPANNRYCSFSFALMDFTTPKQNQFAYRIEGINKDWTYQGTDNEIRLSYLPAGTYRLLVKAADPNGNWSEYNNIIELQVKDFFYNRWWFYVLVATLVTSGGLLLLSSYYESKRKQQEAQQLKEIDELKTRLYANITHEFRTPLTLILGPARQLQQQLTHLSQEASTNIELIIQNGQRLLQLVNQMLDLGKLEAKKLKPDYRLGNVIPLLKYSSDSFHSLAASRNIQLFFLTEQETLMMDYDKDKLLKIMSNLLSNAVKFTSAGGSIEIKVANSKEKLVIKVKDNGIGIAKEKLPYIFDRFYQADDSSVRKAEGTGIGLAYTKELVELLGGTITVQSAEGIGSLFTVLLPIRTEAAPAESMQEEEMQPMAFISTQTEQPQQLQLELPLVLIVEDNADVARFIASAICPPSAPQPYQLMFAPNGKIGLEKAIEFTPDLIISDVMMPEKDGFELCQLLRADERSSHIPILLLTARTDVEDRLAGLKFGANAYLGKPFHEEEIRLHVQNMLALRQQLQRRYSMPSELPTPKEGQAAASSEFNLQLEDAFVHKVVEIIEEQLSNSEFSVALLAEEVNLSASQLTRKLTAVTPFTPVQLIRHIRLNRAKELLLQPHLNVSDVAFQTGFNDPSYFTRIFTREFDITPTDFKKNTAPIGSKF